MGKLPVDKLKRKVVDSGCPGLALKGNPFQVGCLTGFFN